MEDKKTRGGRTAVVTAAAALGLVLGSVGIGAALSPTDAAVAAASAAPVAAPPAAAVQPVQAVQAPAPEAPAPETEAVEDETAEVEGVEDNDATETEGVDDNDETQDPSYVSSITAPEDENLTEEEEAAALKDLAVITPEEATAAALAAVPGTVDKVELDNENGAIVYSVEITDASGKQIDVKVDAGNGTVVHQDADEDYEG